MWGIWDLRTKHVRDGLFLILLGLCDGAAAVNAEIEMRAVQEQLVPRRFTTEQAERFKQVLNDPKVTTAPSRVVVRVNHSVTLQRQKDEELVFAKDIVEAFKSAGWTDIVLDTRQEFSDSDRIGVLVRSPRLTTGDHFDFPALSIALAFKVAGLLVDVEGYTPGEGPNEVEVVIHRRPPP